MIDYFSNVLKCFFASVFMVILAIGCCVVLIAASICGYKLLTNVSQKLGRFF
jgi:hypothetical protein